MVIRNGLKLMQKISEIEKLIEDAKVQSIKFDLDPDEIVRMALRLLSEENQDH